VGVSGALVARVSRRDGRKRLRAWLDAKRAPEGSQAPANGARSGTKRLIGLSSEQTSEPVNHLEEHIPAAMRLERRPTRDDREEELSQLRTEDGRVLALVERVDPGSLVN
jgi:hypothetical protein